MLKKKQADVAVPHPLPSSRPANVVNLMDALRRSVAEEKAPKPAAAKR